jgi:hypothetical protein
MHLSRARRALGLLLAALSAVVAVWVAYSQPTTSTVAPGAVGGP